MTARYVALPLISALLLALLLWRGLGFDPLLAWLIAISLATFLTYGYDKSIAGTSRWRIPELSLYLSFSPPSRREGGRGDGRIRATTIYCGATGKLA